MWGIEDSRYSRQQKIDYAVRITRMYLRRAYGGLYAMQISNRNAVNTIDNCCVKV